MFVTPGKKLFRFGRFVAAVLDKLIRRLLYGENIETRGPHKAEHDKGLRKKAKFYAMSSFGACCYVGGSGVMVVMSCSTAQILVMPQAPGAVAVLFCSAYLPPQCASQPMSS